MLKPTSEMIWNYMYFTALFQIAGFLFYWFYNCPILCSLKFPPATRGNKGQKTSFRINVTVSDVFVLKGLVNIYTNILWHAFISLETSKSHMYRKKCSVYQFRHSVTWCISQKGLKFHPHLNEHLLDKQPTASLTPMFSIFNRRHLLPQWKKWRWTKGVDVTDLFRTSFGGWHLAKQTRQP